MSCRGLAIVSLLIGSIAGCDVPVETFHTLTQAAYLKASHTTAGALFGAAIALSADGTTLAVGARSEASAATGIDGNQTDGSTPGAGAVYVFTRVGETWLQQAYVKASNTHADDCFGCALALSADGSTLAVGALAEDSAATGIDGNQADDSATDAGAVYVFVRTGASWRQQAYVKASNTGAHDTFGTGIALSADGSTLVIGANGEASAATGIDPAPTDVTAVASGAVYVFTRRGETWRQDAYLKASNTDAGDLFGTRVAVSGDGSLLAVGALYESSAATGIGGAQADNSASRAGAVYLFSRSQLGWSQLAYVKASNTAANDDFGADVALSADGSTLAVSASGESSSARGINGDQLQRTAAGAGAVYVFVHDGPTWTQQAYIKTSNADANDYLGFVALSSDGSTLAAGAYGEASAASGVGGDQSDNSLPGSGAVYGFTRTGTAWQQRSYVKAASPGTRDYFGAVALSGNGSELVVGAFNEDSAATGVDGDPGDDSAPDAGAVYVFR